MWGRTFTHGASREEIKSRLSLLSSLTTLLVMTLVAIILVFMYEPLSMLIEFLPDISVTIIVIIALVLTAVVSYLSRVITRSVTDSIELYSGRLDRILTLTREIRDEIYGDILLEKIIRHSVEMTNSQAGAVLVLHGENLVFKASRGLGLEGLTGRAIPADRGISGWVAEHGVPQCVDDVGSNPGFEPGIDSLTDYRVRSVLAVPLRTGKGVLGVIELYNKRGGPFDEGDVEIVNYLGDQAAISLERAEFYEDHRNYELHVTDMLIDLIDSSNPEFGGPEKIGHSKRVARYANVLSRALGMSEEERKRVYFAGLLHDIGFLRGFSRGSSGDEIMKRHALEGYEMLNSINFYRDIAPFVLHHHDRFDGTDSLGGRGGADIPIESRIVAVSEAFDTSSMRNSGDEGHEGAFSEIRGMSGAELDPSLVEIFIKDFESTLG